MKFKQTHLTGRYQVLESAALLGETWKTYRHGETYWKNNTTERLFSTRKEAAEHLIKEKETIE